MSEEKKGPSRRGFLGAAAFGAVAALTDSFPILASKAGAGIDASRFKLTDYKAADRPDGTEESAEITVTANSKSIVVRSWVRRVETGETYTTFQHTTINVPGVAPQRFVSITSATKGEVKDDYRTDTATMTQIAADGTIKESTPRQVRVPLTNALEGLTPQQMFERMLEDKTAGKTPDYLPKEVPLGQP